MVSIDLSEIKDLIQLNINAKEIVNLLIAILEKSESSEARLELLEFISAYDLHNASYFEIFENHLISDAQEEIRALAAEIILRNYLEVGFDALEWTILNDSSPLVLRTIYSFAKKSKSSYMVMLESIITERLDIIAQKYKITIEEVPFLLDLGVKFMNNNFYIGNQDFHFIYENDILCIIKDQHITELGMSFMKEVPESIGLLSELELLDLSFGYITYLPNSMIQLKNLKIINLSWNEFTSIPDILKTLKNLDQIDIANNNVKFIPKWASKINKLIIEKKNKTVLIR